MMDKGNHPMMEMFFHFRLKEVILFEEWTPLNIISYVFSCIAIFAFAFLFELIRSYRMIIIKKENSMKGCCKADVYNSNNGISQLPNEEPPECDCSIEEKIRNTSNYHEYSTFPFNFKVLSSKYHYYQTILYFVQMFWAYSLMLICMTYNVPYVLSVILGHSFAYFILSPFTDFEMEEKVGDCCN
uniref:Copper transport protein n=1 Tax=Parastrongyloides trichosuri TaxID=131310 RepID=A0A0N4ZYB2_PARTI